MLYPVQVCTKRTQMHQQQMSPMQIKKQKQDAERQIRTPTTEMPRKGHCIPDNLQIVWGNIHRRNHPNGMQKVQTALPKHGRHREGFIRRRTSPYQAFGNGTGPTNGVVESRGWACVKEIPGSCRNQGFGTGDQQIEGRFWVDGSLFVIEF